VVRSFVFVVRSFWIEERTRMQFYGFGINHVWLPSSRKIFPGNPYFHELSSCRSRLLEKHYLSYSACNSYEIFYEPYQISSLYLHQNFPWKLALRPSTVNAGTVCSTPRFVCYIILLGIIIKVTKKLSTFDPQIP